MISTEVPMTMTSTAPPSLSLPEFIDYSVKNDLNIVTAKWLSHSRQIVISQAVEALECYWQNVGMSSGYFATYSILQNDSDGNMTLALVDSKELNTPSVESCEIYCVHLAPLKDRSVQLGTINVPIMLEPTIKAPWIQQSRSVPDEKPNFLQTSSVPSEEPKQSATATVSTSAMPHVSSDQTSPAAKRMKMVKVTRSFVENGYQMTETVNEMVPCDVGEEAGGAAASTTNPSTTPTKPAANKPKQSNMLSFFKKK